ncbi:hypothetical protein HDV00_005863 [Rhizophlyctis rosea]|nr:hypothetical protein HDV00_005863 [Rhizophlyctis rosea]
MQASANPSLIADALQGTLHLGSVFFCKHDDVNRRDAKKLIHTLACGLARWDHRIALYLVKLLVEHPDITTKTIPVQFAALIKDALQTVPDANSTVLSAKAIFWELPIRLEDRKLEEFVDIIVQKSAGTFVWLAMAEPFLLGAASELQLRETLQTLPSTVDGLYEGSLCRAYKQHPVLKEMLPIIVISQEPLTPPAIAALLSLPLPEVSSALNAISGIVKVDHVVKVRHKSLTGTDVSPYVLRQEWLEITYDAWRFLQEFSAPISLSAAHCGNLPGPVVIKGLSTDWSPCVKTFEGMGDMVRHVAYSSCGRYIAACERTAINVWEAETGARISWFSIGGDYVRRLAVNGDQLEIVVVSYRQIGIWGLKTGTLLRKMDIQFATDPAISHGGNRLMIAYEDGKVGVRDTAALAPLWTFQAPYGKGRNLCISLDGMGILTAAKEAPRRELADEFKYPIEIWDLQSGAPLQALERIAREGSQAVISKDEIPVR